MAAAMTAPLGILGGTFDPIHLGHLALAREVREALDLAAVRIIPAGDPPHRAAPVATAAHRLAMVQLAVEGCPGLEVDDREIERPGRSYTVLTLAELRAEMPPRPLALIVGADAFLGMPTWHQWEALFDLAHVVVVARPGIALEGHLPEPLAREWARRHTTDAAAIAAGPAGAIFVQAVTPHAISASAIRAAIAAGNSVARHLQIGTLLPPAVLAYIDRNQLYRSRPDAT
jgi:nicotinate-nucleotide adenylyltransferase